MGGIGICCCTVSKARIRNGHGKLVIESGDQVTVLQCRNVAPMRVWVMKIAWHDLQGSRHSAYGNKTLSTMNCVSNKRRSNQDTIDTMHHQLKWVKVFSQAFGSGVAQSRNQKSQKRFDRQQKPPSGRGGREKKILNKRGPRIRVFGEGIHVNY